MLTIRDLSADISLDTEAMSKVSGGYDVPVSWYGITNTPTIDAGLHELLQGQSIGVNQAYNLGGLNLVIAGQNQNGISGQVA